MTTEQGTVRGYKFERICKPSVNVEQLSLKQVDNTESLYSRRLIYLRNANLPPVQMDPDNSADWGLFLMLEYRQDWQPSGYGLGELIYTTSLLPNEEHTIEVKTWETDRRLQELEQGVEERNTSDIQSNSSSSREVTDRHESKEHAYVDAKASYSGFGASAEVKAGWSSDVADMNQQIAKKAASSTEKAANEERATKKTKIVLSRETGAESKTSRRIRNINQTHTLNANFFEVLKEYNVSQDLYEISIVLLGPRVLINQPAYSEEWSSFRDPDRPDDSSEFVSWAELIQGSKNSEWIHRFTQLNGQSPIQIIQNQWSKALARAALPTAKNWGLYPSSHPERLGFQATMLELVRPSDGWVEPDHEGIFRWAYVVSTSREREFLEYVRQFLINPPGGWVELVLGELEKLRGELGRITIGEQRSRTVVVPTQGIYADVTLGICSGGEDFVEVNRQFDLELKRLEIEKLSLEVRRLELENDRLQSGDSSRVVIENASEKTSINVGVEAKQPTSIELKNPGQ